MEKPASQQSSASDLLPHVAEDHQPSSRPSRPETFKDRPPSAVGVRAFGGDPVKTVEAGTAGEVEFG